MEVCVKKMMIFGQLSQNFAQEGKRISGIVKFEKNVNGTIIDIVLTNFSCDSGTLVGVVCIDCQKHFFATSAINPKFTLQTDLLFESKSQLQCLVAVNKGYVEGIAYASNDPYLDSSCLLSSLKNKWENQPKKIVHKEKDCTKENLVARSEIDIKMQEADGLTKYEEFVASCDDFYTRSSKKTFFQEKQQELESLFEKYPLYQPLCKRFKESVWVKITKPNSFFAVGILSKNSVPQYICVALPVKDFATEMQKHMSLFESIDEDFFVLYQSAIDGSCVRFNS